MKIAETDEFKKDFKKLKKRCRTLDADFAVLKKAVTAEPMGDGTKHWNCITRIEEKNIAFFKVRMMCRAVKGSDFRVIYMYDGENIELLFIEMYFKGDKENNRPHTMKQDLAFMKRDDIRRSAGAKNRRCTSRYIEDFLHRRARRSLFS